MRFKTLMLTGLICSWATTHLPAAGVILNEYNSVSGSNRLDDGVGRDANLGLIFGNGGNWFELLVIEDNTDMRGWSLNWTEDEPVNDTDTAEGSITISSSGLWSDLRAGTLITFIETATGGGEDIATPTDTSFDPAADDWWINIATREESGKGVNALVTTTTNDGEVGDFSVGKDDWTLTIVDASGTSIFGPVGEGAGWVGGKVNSKEGGSLEGPSTEDGSPVTLEMWRAITPASSFYDDTGSTSYGMPNQDYDPATQIFTPIQDLSALRGGVNPVLGSGDFDEDGDLTAMDIDALTAHILALGNDARFDVDLNGTVGQSDRQAWVEQVKKTYFGDANLDGEFGTADVVAVLSAGEFQDDLVGNSTWATGDWDGDGEFTSSDFIVALSGGNFGVGPRAAVAAVPEPTGWLLMLLGVLGCRCWRRAH